MGGLMEEEHFSFFPGAVPKEDGNYKGKSIENWSWRDFQNYFDDTYALKFNKRPPYYSILKQKPMVEKAIRLRGKEVLKGMIDFVFANKTKYPQWDTISMTLVCPVHGWSNMIADKVEERLDKTRQ
jgi:hypothetical protein